MPNNSILNDKKQVDIDLLQKYLDSEQLQAVISEARDSLVKAIAGAGKTRTLTYRVAYLIGCGVPEKSIMLITFTNKASREMTTRVKVLLEKDNTDILSGTFHHIGCVFLRKYAYALGYTPKFSILTPDDAKKLIEESRKEYLAKTGLKKSEFPDRRVIYDMYSSSINLKKNIARLNEDGKQFPPDILNGIMEVIRGYVVRKKDSNAMDFDDLLVNFRNILRIDEIRRKITSQYQYILCDEFQDTNHIQYEIVTLLNEENHHLMAVGDPNQAIYGWRGSDITYIQDFEVEFWDSQSFNITYNYRSDANILKLAEYSINNNYADKSSVKITAYRPGVYMPTVHHSSDDIQQAEYMARKILDYKKDGVPLKEIAILIRSNYLTRVLEKTFRMFSIPYKLLAGFSFFERKHILDLLSFLKFMSNPQDETSFKRILGMFDGCGEKTVDKIFDYFKTKNYIIKDIKPSEIKLSKRALEGFNQAISIINKMNDESNLIYDMLNIINTNYYDAYLKNTEEDYVDRRKDVEYLIEVSRAYDDLSEFLNDMALDETEKADGEDDDAITILTYHKSKGMEYEVVFLPMLNEEVFPSSRSVEPEELEEERRLFYVGMTRAKTHLHISYIDFMTQLYKGLSKSLFLEELDESLYIVD